MSATMNETRLVLSSEGGKVERYSQPRGGIPEGQGCVVNLCDPRD